MRLLVEPSTLIRTRVGAFDDASDETGAERGMVLTPSDALKVKKGPPPIDTPNAANGEVVCGPRLRASDLRFSTLILKPDPVLGGFPSRRGHTTESEKATYHHVPGDESQRP